MKEDLIDALPLCLPRVSSPKAWCYVSPHEALLL